jgi:DNA-binding CsgD family transcriptional regulator
MSSDSAQISERERDILRLVAMGATNQQIANQLNISINTVKVHLRNIFEKIGAASRTEATVYAIRQGLVQLGGAPEAAATPALAVPTATPPAEPSAPALAPALAEAPPADPPATPAEHRRRSMILPVALGLILLLGSAVIYLLSQRAPAGTNTPASVNTALPLNQWKSHSAWPQPRSDFAVAAYDGKLYLIGGSLGSAPSAAVERYDPSKDQLVALNAKPTAVSHVQAATIGGKIIVPGGEGAGGQALAICEAYDPRTKQWEQLPPLPAPRSRYALADLEGQLYLFGGWDGARYRGEVFVFDPRTRQWATRTPMPTARRAAGAALVGEHIYVIGGENERGALGVNERYDPNAEGGGAWESVVPLADPIAGPAVIGTVNSVLLFDAPKHTATEYSPAADAWRPAVGVPAEIGLSSRAAALSTSIFLFGTPAAQQPGAISEYQVTYSTLFPIINTGK